MRRDQNSHDPDRHDPRCDVKTSKYEVLACWPHCTNAFTEGLVIHNGLLYESNGPQPPPSSLRRIELRTGVVLQNIAVPAPHFAEGITILNGKIFQLTLDSGLGFIYDVNKLSDPPSTFSYHGWTFGWGITNNGSDLIISDGTAELYYIDPVSLQIKHSIPVHYSNGDPQNSLNELEYFNEAIYANIHDQDIIVRIDPKSGEIEGQIELSALREPHCGLCELNGIAYDKQSNHLFLTGKNWSKTFEIQLL